MFLIQRVLEAGKEVSARFSHEVEGLVQGTNIDNIKYRISFLANDESGVYNEATISIFRVKVVTSITPYFKDFGGGILQSSAEVLSTEFISYAEAEERIQNLMSLCGWKVRIF